MHPAAKFLLAGAFLTTLVFSHLVLQHYHYYLMFTPAVALLCAAPLEKIEAFLAEQGVPPAFITGTNRGPHHQGDSMK